MDSRQDRPGTAASVGTRDESDSGHPCLIGEVTNTSGTSPVGVLMALPCLYVLTARCVMCPI